MSWLKGLRQGLNELMQVKSLFQGAERSGASKPAVTWWYPVPSEF